MSRVEPHEVKEVIETSRVDLEAFIEGANCLVTEVLGGKGLSATRLKEIERWLAAHLVSQAGTDSTPGQVVEEQIGETRRRFSENQISDNLSTTRFGQMALMLDTTGLLAGLGRTTARFTVVAPIITAAGD
jgi:hypothetical protein